MQDLKLALRQPSKYPGFATTVVLTLVPGIGANTAIFALLHALSAGPLSISLDACEIPGEGDLGTRESAPLWEYVVTQINQSPAGGRT